MMTTIRPGLILIKYAESVNIVPRALSEDDWSRPGEPGLAPGCRESRERTTITWTWRANINVYTVSMF